MELPRSTRYDAVVIGAGLIGLACAWRARKRGLSVLVVERADAARRRHLRRGRRDARPGDRGRLRRGGPAAGEPRRRASAGRRSRPSSRRSPGCRPATATAARWWWPPTATTPRRSAACTSSSARSGSTREWLTPSRCRALEPGLSPRIAGGILAPQDGQRRPARDRARARRGRRRRSRSAWRSRRSSTTARAVTGVRTTRRHDRVRARGGGGRRRGARRSPRRRRDRRCGR